MLATLNLQLLPVELLDDSLTGSAAPLPEDAGVPSSGFAQLLRLRADADLPALPGSDGELPREGEPLPQGGNLLPPLNPLSPATVPFAAASGVDGLPAAQQQELMDFPGEGLPVSKLAPDVTAADDVELAVETASEEPASEHPAISLDAAVAYPPKGVPAGLAKLAELPVAIPLRQPVRLAPQAGEVRLETIEGGASRPATAQAQAAQVTRPELAARAQEFFATAGDRPEIRPDSVSLRDRDQQPTPRIRTSSAHVATQQFDVTAKLPPLELPKRTGLLPLQDTGVIRDPVETVSPRPAMPQAQFTPAPAPSAFTATPAAVLGSDSAYATTAQQATDFIGTPVRNAAWGEQISERVVVMAGNNLKSAEIRLTPAELGPLRISVSVDDGAANVTFHAQHAVTREAIEQAMPRLRDMLAENGLSLGQAEVGEQGVAGRDANGQPHDQLSDTAGDESSNPELDDASRAASTAERQSGLVDTFA